VHGAEDHLLFMATFKSCFTVSDTHCNRDLMEDCVVNIICGALVFVIIMDQINHTWIR